MTHGFLIPVIAHTITLRYPLTKHLGATASLNYYSRSVEGKPQRENFSSWMAGADAELQLPDIPAALFAALQGGLRHILILDYQQGSAQPQELLDEYRLTAAISGGVRLFHLGELQIQGVSYGVELAGGMQFGTAGSAEIEEHWKGMRELKPLVPFASLGVTAGFSWGR